MKERKGRSRAWKIFKQSIGLHTELIYYNYFFNHVWNRYFTWMQAKLQRTLALYRFCKNFKIIRDLFNVAVFCNCWERVLLSPSIGYSGMLFVIIIALDRLIRFIRSFWILNILLISIFRSIYSRILFVFKVVCI